MWTPAIFATSRGSHAPGARAATFTVAGDVRRGLEAAGFAVEKKPGFGASASGWRRFSDCRRPRRRCHRIYPYAAANPKRVAILGAGIAGAACAQALARRGIETIVLDAAPRAWRGRERQSGGLVMPRLDRGGGALSELFFAAYLSAVADLRSVSACSRACGVEQRAEPTDGALADLLNDPPLPADWFTAHANGALHPRAGLVGPQAAIKAMLSGAQLQLEAPATRSSPPATAGSFARPTTARCSEPLTASPVAVVGHDSCFFIVVVRGAPSSSNKNLGCPGAIGEGASQAMPAAAPAANNTTAAAACFHVPLTRRGG